jgi:hypothetical protein
MEAAGLSSGRRTTSLNLALAALRSLAGGTIGTLELLHKVNVFNVSLVQ